MVQLGQLLAPSKSLSESIDILLEFSWLLNLLEIQLARANSGSEQLSMGERIDMQGVLPALTVLKSRPFRAASGPSKSMGTIGVGIGPSDLTL